MKVKLKTKNGTFEKNVPDKTHLQAQIKFPAFKQKTKKGKGSYTRKTKHKTNDRGFYD